MQPSPLKLNGIIYSLPIPFLKKNQGLAPLRLRLTQKLKAKVSPALAGRDILIKFFLYN